MITKYENKMLKLNDPLREHKAGSIVKIKTDKDGTPVDRYWRDRVKDAAIDGCVEFVETKTNSKGKK